ncbi:MAG: sigma-70 family RNA polymerase sigma factor, partial [Dehalococcoidia bacterium]
WQPRSPEPSPEEQAMGGELAGEISRAIDALPADQRLALVLADVQGFSYEEVAQAAGCSIGTVKSRLSRARARIRDYFAQRQELLPANLRLDN